MTFAEETVLAAVDAEDGSHLCGIRLGLETCGEDDHVDLDVVWLVVEGFIPAHDKLFAFFLDVLHFSMIEMHAQAFGAVEEFFVAFAEGAHVAVDLMDFSAYVVMDELGELEGIHAAGARAVVVVILVSAADAVEDGNGLGLFAFL